MYAENSLRSITKRSPGKGDEKEAKEVSVFPVSTGFVSKLGSKDQALSVCHSIKCSTETIVFSFQASSIKWYLLDPYQKLRLIEMKQVKGYTEGVRHEDTALG